MNKAVIFLGLLVPVAFVTAGYTHPETTESAKATFAGGCFWCMEEAFEKVDGVASVDSGYAGGTKANPTYQEVSSGRTGHTEAIEVVYDPGSVTYGELLEVFWRNIDPTDGSGQFCDKGSQYRAAIFYHDEEQKRLIDESLQSLKDTKPFAEPIQKPGLAVDIKGHMLGVSFGPAQTQRRSDPRRHRQIRRLPPLQCLFDLAHP